MGISTEWTDKERLAVIQKKAEAIMTALREGGTGSAFYLADDIKRLADTPAEFLEANRRRLLEGVE